jgi:hypothetical protein
MATSANVESVDAIRDFRIHLTKFQELAGRALSDADSDINKTTRWLEGEALTYWNGQIRKRQEAVAKAEEAVRQKRLYKDASGSTQSAVEEMKQLKIAKDRLNEAQEKLKAVKHWTRELLKQVTMYRGNVSRFANDVQGAVPEAIAHLGATVEQLDKYMDITATSGAEEQTVGASAGGGEREGEPSMARAAEEAPQAKKAAVDPAALRAAIPTQQAIFAAKPGEAGPVHLTAGKIDASQSQVIAQLASEAAPGDEAHVIMAENLTGAQRLFVVRLDSASGGGWYIGDVEGRDTGVYNKVRVGDLRAGRADLADLLKLPTGSLAVVGQGGLEALFDASDRDLLAVEG